MIGLADDAPPAVDRAAAIDALGTWLARDVGGQALTAKQLEQWRGHGFTNGWRLPPFTHAGISIILNVLIDGRFPWTRTRVGWWNAPPFPSIPHVESDQLLCIFSSTDEVDPRDPVGVVQCVLAGAAEILEAGLSGANKSEFKNEFLSYWHPGTKHEWVSLCNPCGPSRSVAIWHAARTAFVAEDTNALCAWVRQRFGRTLPPRRVTTGALLWLPEPLLPEQYPRTVDDLQMLVARLGGDDQTLLAKTVARGTKNSSVIFGAPTGNGVAFAGINLCRRAPDGFRKRYRRGQIPKEIMFANVARSLIERSNVTRADAWWVHGRDSNPAVTGLSSTSIGVIGCGSLGSSIARILAQAGVGKLTLIDPESLTYANTGRHVLGAGAANQPKALALRTRLERDFPHLRFCGFVDGWQSVWNRRREDLSKCNLLISTVGSWSQEGELNEWHRSGAFAGPIVYGWGEPLGVGGHAVALGAGSGCLACGMKSHGEPRLKVADFEGSTLRQEGACGVYFQPYGAAEIEAVAILVANLALDSVLGRSAPGTHRLLAATAAHVERATARFNPLWIALSEGRTRGGNQEETTWGKRSDCPMCGGQGL